MLVQLAVGLVASSLNIVIHSLLMALLIRVARGHAIGMQASSWRLARLMAPVVCVLMVAHLAEVAIWAVTYDLVGAAPESTDGLYFAFVNYTTLGYGDVLPLAHWRLLGPFTAMNGILLFGWSTAVIFECCAAPWREWIAGWRRPFVVLEQLQWVAEAVMPSFRGASAKG